MDKANEKVFNRYIEMLKGKEVEPKNNIDAPLSLEHAYWMCEECFKNDWSLSKVSRWLGFIQAVLVMHKITTVNEERNETRLIFN